MENTWIGQVVISDPKLHEDEENFYCTSTHAIQMLTVSTGGEKLPFFKNPTGYDVLCNPPQLMNQMYMTNVTFFNMKENYTGINCGDNRVFRYHETNEENLGTHILNNVRCQQCDKEMLFKFGEMKPSHAGWFGGCGNFSCTGKDNAII